MPSSTSSTHIDAYPRLFEPGRLGPISVSNRIVLSPLTSNYADEDGFVTPQLLGFYEARASGGVGLVMVEGAVVSREGKGAPRQLMAHTDAHVDGLRDLADSIHAADVPAVLQLIHQGRQTRSAISGSQPVAPSSLVDPVYNETPKELGLPEIRRIVDDFSQAARRGRDAGFDGVELHGAHGYLIGNFLSQATNHRTDEYGGTLAKRARFLLEIISRIRSVAGDAFPILVRLSAEESVPDGITVDETCVVAQYLERAGVAALDLSAGTRESHYRLSPTAGTPEGVNTALSRLTREHVDIPVVVVGRFRTPAGAEKALADGAADFVSLGRALIADPEWPNKVAGTVEAAVSWCIGCNVCAGRSRRPEIRCPVNPFVGRERDWEIRPAKDPVSVAVVGSGWPGLEAARIAALRGHHVTLLEPSSRFGGLSQLRSLTPMQGELADAVSYWMEELSRLDVRIRSQLDPIQHIRADAPRAVWLALPPPVRPSTSAWPVPAYSIREVLSLTSVPGGAFAVWGDSLIAAETAAYLARGPRHVSLLAKGRRIATDTNATLRHYVTEMLEREGVMWRVNVDEDRERTALGVDYIVYDEIVGDPSEVSEPFSLYHDDVTVLGDDYNPSELVGLVERAANIALSL